MLRPRIYFKYLLGITLLLPAFFSIAIKPALATCCKCVPKDSTNVNVCIETDQTDCAKLKDSKNAFVKEMSCTLVEGLCKSINEGGVCTQGPTEESVYAPAESATAGKAAAASGQAVSDYPAPTLGVAIPGLKFSSDLEFVDGEIRVPWFAQYISAIHTYIIGISVVVAAIAIAYGGILYIVGSAAGTIQKGKTVITDALIGLFLVLGAYTILSAINQATVQPRSLSIPTIKRKEGLQSVNLSYKIEGGKIQVTATPEALPGDSTPITPSNQATLADDFKALPGAPQIEPGSVTLPDAPGSKGWLRNGNCNFELNQAGKPTALSKYKCAIEVVSKEEGIDPCYLIAILAQETYYMQLDRVVHGEDEHDFKKGGYGGREYPPSRYDFLISGKSYKLLKGNGGFSFPPLSKDNPNPIGKKQNDDSVDMTKEDLGLDGRFGHAIGLVQSIPSGCPIERNRKRRLEPYYALKSGAQWVRCTLDQLKALEYQKYPGTIYNVFLRWAGCYPKCVDEAKDSTVAWAARASSDILKGAHRAYMNYCLKQKSPYNAIPGHHINICTGDLPLDKEACKAYIEGNVAPLVPAIKAKTACAMKTFVSACFDKSLPVACKALDTVCKLR